MGQRDTTVVGTGRSGRPSLAARRRTPTAMPLGWPRPPRWFCTRTTLGSVSASSEIGTRAIIGTATPRLGTATSTLRKHDVPTPDAAPHSLCSAATPHSMSLRKPSVGVPLTQARGGGCRNHPGWRLARPIRAASARSRPAARPPIHTLPRPACAALRLPPQRSLLPSSPPSPHLHRPLPLPLHLHLHLQLSPRLQPQSLPCAKPSSRSRASTSARSAHPPSSDPSTWHATSSHTRAPSRSAVRGAKRALPVPMPCSAMPRSTRCPICWSARRRRRRRRRPRHRPRHRPCRPCRPCRCRRR
ncbi:hypothetical protein BC831DRAFT_41883 [Entophlyctis helioformis]|nr:hypothetical protein BC831DRAFT_41883 [Entophlyctis helioformis]